MNLFSRSRMSVVFSLVALVTIIGGVMMVVAARGVVPHAYAVRSAHSSAPLGGPLCAEKAICADTAEPQYYEGRYIGHDEPSNLFYSNVPGSGNRMQYHLTLPTDPSSGSPLTPGKAFNFQLHPTFWFGMALCDTQSFPEQVSTCTPNSDSNIVDPAISPAHPGMAFMELQFYPPGWVLWPGGNSCDATKWCAAINIFSFLQNAVTGQFINDTCLGSVGPEPDNFAFLTKSGVPHAPPNPVQQTLDTFTVNPATDAFFNSGDKLVVTLRDTPSGLTTVVNDKTTGQTGSMTASAANGFGQVQFLPNPSTACNNIPNDFHPMYSTSSEQTRVTWAAHSYNIAFSDEIGHWDYCTGTAVAKSTFGVNCPGGTGGNTEGNGANTEPTNKDNTFCFPASQSTLVQLQGCLGENDGFDGVPYQPVWPDGNTALHPTSVLFSSPLTGAGFDINYNRTAFEADLPRIEIPSVAIGGICNRSTGIGCTLIPPTDDCSAPGICQPAAFYPFYSTTSTKEGGQCLWQLGNHIPGSSRDFGQNAQWGTLLNVTYTAIGGGQTTRYNDFRQILDVNPCQAPGNQNGNQG